MINILNLDLKEYYKLKMERDRIDEQLLKKRKEIIEQLNNIQATFFCVDEYEAEIKYSHCITSDFIQFLKVTNNYNLIKETSTCSAYKLMDMKYHFTQKQKEEFYVLKDTPSLYVRKRKK